MRIAEIYRSIQGEGLLTGTPSVFVRASGCNLRCWYCDTPHASWEPAGSDLSVDEIVAEVEEWDPTHVVLTGGEPMLFAELLPLCEALQQRDKHLTVETAGTLFLPVACDLMSISPKLAGKWPVARATCPLEPPPRTRAMPTRSPPAASGHVRLPVEIRHRQADRRRGSRPVPRPISRGATRPHPANAARHRQRGTGRAFYVAPPNLHRTRLDLLPTETNRLVRLRAGNVGLVDCRFRIAD